jgi:drug/metabolite transporter (DMT)-like permease
MSPVSHFRAVLFAIGGFTAWVLTDTCIKLAGDAAVPPYEVLAAIGCVTALLAFARAASRDEIALLIPRKPVAQIGRALIASGSTFLNAIAVKHLPLTSFYVVIFMAPMVIAVAAAFLFHEKLSWQKIAAVVAGFLGVLYAIDPFTRDFSGDGIGYVAVGAGVVAFAANFLWLRRMTQYESTQSLLFTSALVAAVAGSVAMLMFHPEILPGRVLMILGAAGVLNALGNLLNYAALKHTTAANVAQFHYTQIITGALMGYLIWHDVPGLHLWIGAGVIIASGCYIAAHAHRAGRDKVGGIL